jgi:hypothetical protein
MTQLQSEENDNTLDHLGEAGSKLKLAAFPEKSFRPNLKSSFETYTVGGGCWPLLTIQLLM